MNKDHLYEIMIHMNIIDLYQFCKISKELCNNMYFWKLKNQYDGVQDDNIITLNYIIILVKDILNLNMDIHIGLPEDIYYKHKTYKELHQLLNLKNIPYRQTYDDIIIKKYNNQYKLKILMVDSVTHYNIYKYKTMINKQQLSELLIYLLYNIDDYRYYALSANHKITNRKGKTIINFQPKDYYI
jgi:hypothetical protein